jgi:hypothetical protein
MSLVLPAPQACLNSTQVLNSDNLTSKLIWKLAFVLASDYRDKFEVSPDPKAFQIVERMGLTGGIGHSCAAWQT